MRRPHTVDTCTKFKESMGLTTEQFTTVACGFGQMLKDEAIVKLQSKRKKIEVTEKELVAQTPAYYFINKIALVDPVEGEIVITYDRVMAACQKFEPDEMYMLYERLRHIKVAKLRDAHGTDIVSIIDGARGPPGHVQRSFGAGR